MAAEFKINKEYAERYNVWREKEELQKLKTKYGEDADLEDSSSSETEDEDAEALTPQIEKDWLKTLSALKNKDPRIYDKNVKFYHDETSSSSDSEEDKIKKKKQKNKPMYLKDYERKLVIEKKGIADDESDEDVDKDGMDQKPGYYEEQEEIKESFKAGFDDSESDEDASGLLSERKKSKEDEEKEEQEYLQWLKGQKKELVADENTASDLKPLKSYWSKPDLGAGEKFLRDYILNKRYVDDDDDERIPTYDEIVNDEVDFSEEEDILEKQEGFERKYNFRYEEPDEDFIKAYPRTVQDSLRRKDSQRAQKRQEVKERKKIEKEKKKEELRQLKNLKKKEIISKLETIKEITGNSKLAFNEEDMEADFDPESHEKMMQQTFDDDYYGGADEDTKPVFSDDEEYGLQVENWDAWEGYHQEDAYEDYTGEEPHCDDPNFNMDADYNAYDDRSFGLDGTTKKKKKSKFKEALMKKKPVFDPEDTTFEKYFDEYYKLDYEDIVGDTPCRFNYRTTVQNDFGLSTDEILQCKDKELNAWVSLKKMSQYRTEEEEAYDVNIYKRKAHNQKKKFNILTSMKEDVDDRSKAVEMSSKKASKNKPEATITSAEAASTSQPGNRHQASDKNPIDSDTKFKKRKIESDLDTKTLKKIKIDSLNTDDSSRSESNNTSNKKKKQKKESQISLESKTITLATETNDYDKTVEENSVVDLTNISSDTRSEPARCNEKSSNKKKKRKHKKKPTISDERLKAYGIDPKKFKYMDKSKLQHKHK